jgi:methylated-DNA-[protein]-cysteine S-methyltransferase
MTTLHTADFGSPLGDLRAIWDDAGLCSLMFTEHWQLAERTLRRRFGGIAPVAAPSSDLPGRIAAYFAGDFASLDGIAIDPGGTPFQQSVWAALRRIRPGETTTYAQLARGIGAPTAVRAVGAANGANPIWLIIPCHRAIGSDGRLVGYAGGLERKRWLLAHEAAGQRPPLALGA